MEGLENGSEVPCGTAVQEPARSSLLAAHGGQRGRSRTRSYSIDFKLDVLTRLEQLEGNISATARAFGIPRQCVQDWVKSQSKLRACADDTDVCIRKRRNMPSSEECKKKRAKFPDMEAELSSWICQQRHDGLPVCSSTIKVRAQQILEKEGMSGDFQASNGWLERFLKRYDIVCRTVTSVGQKVPPNAHLLCESFFDFHNSSVSGVPVSCIGNMDETPLWFDLPQTRTFDFKGVKQVKCKTTGKEKLRYTVVLSAMADGTKLKPMIIFKGLKNVPKFEFPKEVVVTVAMKGSMTAELMNTYKQKVWGTRPGAFFKPRAVLVMDSAPAHLKHATKTSFKQHYNTSLSVIPGGLTPLLQPADVVWNRPFKAAMKEKWLNWLQGGDVEFTRTGKRRSASYLTVAVWVKESWDQVSEDLVRDSFVKCGLVGHQEEGTLHSHLRDTMAKGAPCFADAEATGLTDTESDAECEDE